MMGELIINEEMKTISIHRVSPKRIFFPKRRFWI